MDVPLPSPFDLKPCQRDWRRGLARRIRREWTRITRLAPSCCEPFKTQLCVEQAQCGRIPLIAYIHWLLPQEVQSFQSGLWRDTHYDACCWGGARYKRQRLRHNIDEIAAWPPLQCHHIHSETEWEPQQHGKERWYPSAEEAEYTAPLAFAIAVSVSWWAARVGKAKLAVPRMPLPGCVGRREAWLSFDPRLLREWAMTPLALSLGLGAPCASEAGRIPPRMTVEAVKQADGTLPHNAVYVGQGHHTHRIPKTKWAPPMAAGHDCPFDEFLPRYLQHVRDNLLDQIHELFGKTLVVDSITAFPSEGDALASLVFEALSEQAREPRAGRTRKFAKRVANRPGSSFPKALGLALIRLWLTLPRCSPCTCSLLRCGSSFQSIG